MEVKKSYSMGELLDFVKTGYDDGMADGYDRGLADGYNRGSADGYVRGSADGYDEGYDEGYRTCMMTYYTVLEGSEAFEEDCKALGIEQADGGSENE